MQVCHQCQARADDRSQRCPDCGAVLVGSGLPSRPPAPGGTMTGGFPPAVAAPSQRWRRGHDAAAERSPAPGSIRAKLIRLLGGQPAAPPPAYGPPEDEEETEAFHTSGVSRPGGPPAPPTTPPSYEPAHGVARTTIMPPFPTEEQDEETDTRTVAGFGIDISRLKIPKFTYTIQIFDASSEWRDWGPISAQGLNIGRSKNTSAVDIPALMSLGVRHMRLSYENSELVVEDLGSINGVYLKINRPVPLVDGTRFRLGQYVFEFRRPEPPAPAPALRTEEGEEFCGRDLLPLAYLDLIRPNNEPGMRFPITREDVTILGRDSKEATLALPKDTSISSQHAMIRHEDGKFFLEDLRSRNGTFIRIEGKGIVHADDILLAGQVLFRVHDPKAG